MGPLLYARCLGEPLLLDRHRVPVKLRVRKHLALVLFLVVEPRHRASRERLKRMFWPEGKSGQSLSQALLELKAALGADVFDISEHYVGLQKGIVMERDLDLLSSGDADQLLKELSNSFWGHVLFDGMEFEDAEEWNTWLQVERGRWTSRIADAVTASLQCAHGRLTEGEEYLVRRWQAGMAGSIPSPQTDGGVSSHLDPAGPQERLLRIMLQGEGHRRITVGHHPSALDGAILVNRAIRWLDRRAQILFVDCASESDGLGLTAVAAVQQLRGASGATPESYSAASAAIKHGDLRRVTLRQIADLVKAASDESSVWFVASGRGPLIDGPLVEVTELSDSPLIILRPSAPADSPPEVILQPLGFASFRQRLRQLSAAVGLPFIDYRWLSEVTGASPELAVSLVSAGISSRPVRESARDPALVAQIRKAIARHLCVVEPIADRTATTLSARIYSEHNGPRKQRMRATAKAPLSPCALLVASLDASPREELLSKQLAAGSGDQNLLKAILLNARAHLGAPLDVIAHEVRARLASIEDADLSPIEALNYARLLSTSQLVERSGVPIENTLLHRQPTSDAERLASVAVRLISAQHTRCHEQSREALQDMHALQLADRRVSRVRDWMRQYGLSMISRQHGDYRTGLRLSLRAMAHAQALQMHDATQISTSAAIGNCFSLGNYSEVVSLVRQLGPCFVAERARRALPLAVHAAVAAEKTRSTDVARWVAPIVDREFLQANSARAVTYGFTIFAKLGHLRRARQLADTVLRLSGPSALVEEEGAWYWAASEVLSQKELLDTEEQLLPRLSRIDALDRQIMLVASRKRGTHLSRLMPAS